MPRPVPKDAKLSFALQAELRGKVLAIAEREDEPISEVLRQLVTVGLQHREERPA
jgi:hypothetical protein